MSEPAKDSQQAETDLAREIREGRKFTLAEAIGRLAGPGAMKGVSPRTGIQQAEAVIERFLEQHLDSPAGALGTVLFRQVKASETLLNNFAVPLVAIASEVQRILDSNYLLKDLTRRADCEWGRVYGERPYFEKQGAEPNDDDPYTAVSVRQSLTRLCDRLEEAIAE